MKTHLWFAKNLARKATDIIAKGEKVIRETETVLRTVEATLRELRARKACHELVITDPSC